MTDKQIIINGVDVSECIYYQYNMCTATKDNYGDCLFYCKDYDMNDCYYKQLQREKQSSQEARDTAIKEFNRAEELKTLLTHKEQECEKLKVNNNQFIKDNEFLAKRNSKLKAKNEELKKILNEGCLHNLTLMTEQRVLLQTLAEIKEIAEKEVNNRMLFADKESFCDFNKILQKISEVEENE